MEKDRLIRDEESNTPTEIICVIDRSGSMYPLVQDTVGGFNQFLKEQKELPGEAYITLVTFSGYGMDTLIEECRPVKEMPDITEQTIAPMGSTALWDAVGKTLDAIMPRLLESDTKVMVVIITDGEENDSKQYTAEMVKAKVEECRSKDWQFLFFGANIDSFSVGAQAGFDVNTTHDYDATGAGTRAVYASVSSFATNYRQG